MAKVSYGFYGFYWVLTMLDFVVHLVIIYFMVDS